MSCTRRTLLSATALGFASLKARADSIVIEPITPTSMLKGHYARFANPGPYGIPIPVESQITAQAKARFFLPKGKDKPRVVVFSHAELAPPPVYDKILSHWASHGFAVIAPAHDDSVLIQGLNKAYSNGTWSLPAMLDDPETWATRAARCAAVLDVLPTLSMTTGIRFESDRVLLAGHSFGAYTCQKLLGVKSNAADGSPLDLSDPRFYGGLLMSPQGSGIMGLTQESWSNVTRPLMVVTGIGDGDGGARQEANVKVDAFRYAHPDNKHLAWFSNINSGIYSGQQVTPGTKSEIILGDLLAVTTAFLTAYGDYNPEAFTELAGDYYTKATDKRVTMYYR